MKKIILITFILGLSACGGSDKKTPTGNFGMGLTPNGEENEVTGSSSTSESYTYTLSQNGCETGTHAFTSLKDYCDGLKDHALNHGCAYDLRKADFHHQCSGFGSFDLNDGSGGSSSVVLNEEMNFTVTARHPQFKVDQGQGDELLASLHVQFNLPMVGSLSAKLDQVQPEIVMPDANGCRLNSIEFSNADSRGEASYTLKARDASNTNRVCTNFIARIFHEGGVFKFRNVPVSGYTNGTHKVQINLFIKAFDKR